MNSFVGHYVMYKLDSTNQSEDPLLTQDEKGLKLPAISSYGPDQMPAPCDKPATACLVVDGPCLVIDGPWPLSNLMQ